MKDLLLRKQREISFANSTVMSLLGSAILILSISSATTIVITVTLGNIVGNAALCAVNLVLPVYGYGVFLCSLIYIGSSIMYFRNLGTSDENRANEIFGQSIILSVVLGILMFIAMILLKDVFIESLNVSATIRTEAEIFWKYMQYMLLVAPLEYLLSQFLYTDIRLTICSNVAMIISLTVSSIFLTKLYGTAGVGIGLMISKVLYILILCIHFFRKDNILSFRWHLSLKDIVEMCRLSLVDASKYLDDALLVSFINAYVIEHFSEEKLVVTSVAIAIYGCVVVFDSIGIAMMPVAEVYLGEENNQDENRVAQFALQLSLIFGVAIMLLLLVFAPLLPFVFGVSDPAIVANCIQAIRIIALAMPMISVIYTLISQYVTIRKITLAFVYEWSKAFILPLFCILFFGRLIGFNGIWVAILGASTISILIFAFAVRFFSGNGKKSILLVPDNEYPSFSRSYYASKESAITARDDIESFLTGQGVLRENVMLVMLCIEEMTQLLLQKNRGRKVIVQYTVRVERDCVRVYERDNGIAYDLMDTNSDIVDFRKYVLDCLIDTCDHKQYLMVISYNRNIFSIKL